MITCVITCVSASVCDYVCECVPVRVCESHWSISVGTNATLQALWISITKVGINIVVVTNRIGGGKVVVPLRQ